LPLIILRLLPLVAVAFAGATDTPATPRPLVDDDIRATFVGRAACPPQPWPVGVGPHEFLADGRYRRARDVASAHGRYTIADGRICVTLAESERPDFCLAVFASGGRFLFRLDDTPPAVSPYGATPVEPCALPSD
jgi:hypothetical protein